MAKHYTEDDVIAMLEQEIKKAGSQAAWADNNHISRQYVSDVVNGRRSPGLKVFRALGLFRVVEYTKEEGS